jgi:hypothetical protein
MRLVEFTQTLAESDNPVANAITRRILLQRTDLLSNYGPALVTQAIDDVADFVGDTEEIGSSDVSGWIKQVEQSLAGMGQQGVGEASKPDAYQRDEINATSGFGKNSYAYQQDGGANDEDHESDRRREQQVQSGTWYIRLNGKLIRDKQGNPYSFNGKAAANKAALTMQAKLFNQGKEFMLTTNPNDKQQGMDPKVTEAKLPEGEERVDTLVTKGLGLMRGPTWLDAVAAIKYQVGERDYRERKEFYDFFVKQLVDRYGKKGVAEGYDPVESDYQQWEDILVKDGYRGDPSGAYALKLVVGHQLMLDPAEVASTIRNILTYVKQNRQVLGKAVSDRTTVKDAIIDIKNKFPQQYQAAQQPQGVAEAGFPGAPDVEMPPMKPSGDPQRDKLKQEYIDIHHEIKSLVDIPYSSDSSPEQKMQAKARIKQLNNRADQIKAILEPRQPPNEWQKKTYGYDDNWNIVKKGVAASK